MRPLRFIALVALLSATVGKAADAPSAATPPATPGSLATLEAVDRLLACKATFADTVQRHFDASKALKSSVARIDARRAAVDQALALAVLNEAKPDAGEPEARHQLVGLDKRAHTDVIAYCRSIVIRYVDLQSRERPQYLSDLRPAAEALVAELDTEH